MERESMQGASGGGRNSGRFSFGRRPQVVRAVDARNARAARRMSRVHARKRTMRIHARGAHDATLSEDGRRLLRYMPLYCGYMSLYVAICRYIPLYPA